jgi:hypothetical protein
MYAAFRNIRNSLHYIFYVPEKENRTDFSLLLETKLNYRVDKNSPVDLDLTPMNYYMVHHNN